MPSKLELLASRLRVLYLHGFASSPFSRKARYLQDRFVELGIPFSAPDLAEGDFFGLTISKQLRLIGDLAGGAAPLVIIGSSLGGYLAALHAATRGGVEHLILLAPAFDFHRLWMERLGPDEVRRWQASGKLSVFHYGQGGQADLSYEFLSDAEGYPGYPNCQVSSLIFHGTQDDLVPIANSQKFTADHPEAQLVRLDSGHELTDVLEPIWQGTRGFLSL